MDRRAILLGILLLSGSGTAAVGGTATVTLDLTATPMNCLAAVMVAADVHGAHPDFLFRGRRGEKLEDKLLYLIGSGFADRDAERRVATIAQDMKAFIFGVSRFDDMIQAMRDTPLAREPRAMEHFLADCQVATDDALAAEVRELRAFRRRVIENLAGPPAAD